MCDCGVGEKDGNRVDENDVCDFILQERAI